MEIRLFLPDSSGLRCDGARMAEGAVTLDISSTVATARVPPAVVHRGEFTAGTLTSWRIFPGWARPFAYG